MSFTELAPYIKFQEADGNAIVALSPGAKVQVKKGAEMSARLNGVDHDGPLVPAAPVEVELLGEVASQNGGKKFKVGVDDTYFYVAHDAIELLAEDAAKLHGVPVAEILFARDEHAERV